MNGTKPLGLGTVLRSNAPPRHLWIILSDPFQTAGSVLLVNFTTLREQSADDECILTSDEYPGVLTSPQSVIAFSRAKVGSMVALEAAVNRGDFTVVATPLPGETLAEIIEAGRNSKQLSDAKKRLLPSR